MLLDRNAESEAAEASILTFLAVAYLFTTRLRQSFVGRLGVGSLLYLYLIAELINWRRNEGRLFNSKYGAISQARRRC